MEHNIDIAIICNNMIHTLRNSNNFTVADGQKYSNTIDFYNKRICDVMGWPYDA